MLNNSGDSAGFPEPDIDAASVDAGRLGGFFLRLHRHRFTGLAYVASGDRTITFLFRNGAPVLAEEPGTDSSLADQLLDRGLITRDEYADVIARVTEELVDNEDVAFGEHAVELGYLTPEQLKAELSERVRAKVMSSLALKDCVVELDGSPDALSGRAEYPQKIGPMVYLGVRTFYLDEELRRYLPDLKRNYGRLLKSSAEITKFFELDYEEVALLNSIEPEARASTWFDDCDLDRSHALQLLGLLYVGQFCEFSTSPFESEDERMGPRPEPARQGSRVGTPAARGDSGPRPGSRAGMPAVRDEIYEPRSAARAGVPAARSDSNKTGERREGSGAYRDPRPASEQGSGLLRDPRPPREEGSGAFNSPLRGYTGQAPAREEGSGAFHSPLRSRTGVAPASSSAHLPVSAPLDERADPATHAAVTARPAPPPGAAALTEGPLGGRSVEPQPMRNYRQGGEAIPGVGRAAQAKENPVAEPPSAARPVESRGVTDAAAEALEEARARVARDGKRGGGYAAQRVVSSATGEAPAKHEAGARRDRTGQVAIGAERAPASPPAATPEYQKAHLQEIMARRRQGATVPDVAVPKRDPAREFRSALESLRDHQYSRAEEQFRALLEQQPENDAIRAHHLWAQLRASQAFDPAQASALRDLAKKLVSDAEHAGFACYVLGHLYLADKKDEQAEKYFRKAHGIDKTNKDAERHVVILERRKQQAADGEVPGQRKIFGITLNKPK